MTVKITLSSCSLTIESREDALWIAQRLEMQEADQYSVDEKALEAMYRYLKVHQPKAVTFQSIRNEVTETRNLHGKTINAALKRMNEYEVGSKMPDGTLVFFLRALPKNEGR